MESLEQNKPDEAKGLCECPNCKPETNARRIQELESRLAAVEARVMDLELRPI